MNRLRQTRNILSKLKRNFGTTVIFRVRTNLNQDLETGDVSFTDIDTKIRRAIVLPFKELRKFIYDISYLAANKNFTYGGFFDANDRVVIVDKKDLKTGPTNDAKIILDNLEYNIKSQTTTEGYAGYIFAISTMASKEAKLDGDAFVYVEGQIRDTSTQTSYYEVRIDGPDITQFNHDRYKLRSEVNILCSANHIEDENMHRIYHMAGLVASLFIPGIPIYQYGDGDAQLGCAELIQDLRKRERIQTSHFGQIDPNVPLMQATVEGHYELTMSLRLKSVRAT